MRDGSHILERLPGIDQVGEDRVGHVAIDILDPDRSSGHADDRMQDAEAATVGFEAGRRKRIGLECQFGFRGGNSHGDGERASIRAGAMGGIANGEAAIALFYGQIVDARAAGTPVAIAHEIGNGPQHLDTIVADRSQVAVCEIGGKPPGRKRHRLLFGLVRTIEGEGFRCHPSIASISTALPEAALS